MKFNSDAKARNSTSTGESYDLEIRISVNSPQMSLDTTPVFLAGTLDPLAKAKVVDWAPNGVKMARVDSKHYEATLRGKKSDLLDYLKSNSPQSDEKLFFKFTLGSWAEAERTDLCEETTNREIDFNGVAPGSDGITRISYQADVPKWHNHGACLVGYDLELTISMRSLSLPWPPGNVYLVGVTNPFNTSVADWDASGLVTNYFALGDYYQVILRGFKSEVREHLAAPGYEYTGGKYMFKYTWGSWANRELRDDCGETQNREVDFEAVTPDADGITRAGYFGFVEEWSDWGSCGAA